jgi:hypothetical protein
MVSAIRPDCAMPDWWLLDWTRMANRQARAASSFKFANHVPNELVVKQAIIRRLRELSTATDQAPVGGRFGFSENPGRPTRLSEGYAIYLRPQYILLGYESDRFARCDSACRIPIIAVSSQRPNPHCHNGSHRFPEICIRLKGTSLLPQQLQQELWPQQGA